MIPQRSFEAELPRLLSISCDDEPGAPTKGLSDPASEYVLEVRFLAKRGSLMDELDLLLTIGWREGEGEDKAWETGQGRVGWLKEGKANLTSQQATKTDAEAEA